MQEKQITGRDMQVHHEDWFPIESSHWKEADGKEINPCFSQSVNP